ncbi:hypothetical protein [Alicyclobacillus sp. SP_1]|uniref:hypothetical protein n=1 Tax=Alicyclobacillus sp. SP_1 TaxID=2942475 RepID=UPI00215729CD|nr:hypothetical protein [Alicyclobacillus sp. SP_1]
MKKTFATVSTAAVLLGCLVGATPSFAASQPNLPPSLKAQIQKNIQDGNTLPVRPVSSASTNTSLASTLVYSWPTTTYGAGAYDATSTFNVPAGQYQHILAYGQELTGSAGQYVISLVQLYPNN